VTSALSAYLRHNKREAIIATPPAAGAGAVRAEPPAVTEPVRAEQARNTVGILDGLVHGDDPPQTHGFQLIVAKLFTDETGDFCVRRGETALVGFGTDLLRDPIAVLEEHALEDGDLVGHAVGRREVVRAE